MMMMIDLPLVALLGIGFGYWLGQHRGFRRGVKACIALARGEGETVSKRLTRKCEDSGFVEGTGEEDDDEVWDQVPEVVQ